MRHDDPTVKPPASHQRKQTDAQFTTSNQGKRKGASTIDKTTDKANKKAKHSEHQVGAFAYTPHSYPINSSRYAGNKEIGEKRAGKRIHRRRPPRARKRLVRPPVTFSSPLILLRSLCRDITNTGVHILHDCVISEEERLVLSLGLNFVPPPCKSKSLLLHDAITRFSRAVRIKKHFAAQQYQHQTSLTTELLLHMRVNKSLSIEQAKLAFEPDTIHSPIENYLKTLNTTLTLEATKPTKTSSQTNLLMWKEYYKISKQLGSRDDIIIKASDKNLGVTVMNKDWYVAQANVQLNNTEVYTKIVDYPDINKLINDLKSIITNQDWLALPLAKKLFKDLTIDVSLNRVKLCRMYFLPKLHKNPIGMRPICASQGWITYWTSVYVHMVVFPLLKQIPSYIANSAHLVSKLDKIKPPDHFQFIEADVKDLYTSINIEEGLHALKYFLKRSTNMHSSQVQLIVLLTRWVLTNNYVMFGVHMYLQTSGTAMGTPCAVIFACIFVHVIEQEALDTLRSTMFIAEHLYLFVRFIDDLSIIVTTYEIGMALMKALNSRRKSIQFTFRIRNSDTTFLDLTLFKKIVRHVAGQRVAVRAYSKPMNKFLFLPPNSCHPKHIFNGWMVGYGKRLRLNCSEDQDFETCLADFQTRLTARGYSKDLIAKAFEAIPSRQAILNSITNAGEGRHDKAPIGTPFVVTYSPDINAMLPSIKKALSLSNEAYLDPHVIQIFGHRTMPLLSFKRGSNLRDMVSPSALQSTIITSTP